MMEFYCLLDVTTKIYALSILFTFPSYQVLVAGMYFIEMLKLSINLIQFGICWLFSIMLFFNYCRFIQHNLQKSLFCNFVFN
jgi:uncharacterized membrane protein (GlpM family)